MQDFLILRFKCFLSKEKVGGRYYRKKSSDVQNLTKNILELFDLRNELEKQVDEQMNEVAPNLSTVLGTTVVQEF